MHDCADCERACGCGCDQDDTWLATSTDCEGCRSCNEEFAEDEA